MLNQKKLKITNLVFLTSIIISLNSVIVGQSLSIFSEIRYLENKNSSWFTNYNNFGHPSDNLSSRLQLKSSKKKISLKIDTLILNQNFYILESFVKIKSSLINYKIGRYYRDFSNYLNDDLSSGHMLISNNAQPMPKIGLLKTIVLDKRKRIEFDFGLSHAVLDKNDNYLKKPFLHEKFIYLKIPLDHHSSFQIGFIHEAIWGGETLIEGESTGSSLKDFFKVFISSDGPMIQGSKHANALGNHLGIWDFVFLKQNGANDIKIYYQHFFEDTSGLRFHNGTDGLWGFEIANTTKNLNILFEILTTTNQDLNSDYLREGYYNHSTYVNGWSYKNFVIGNPHINNSTIIPLDVGHIGFEKKFKNELTIRVLASRRVDKSDTPKYNIFFKKKIIGALEAQFGISSSDLKDVLSFSVSREFN